MPLQITTSTSELGRTLASKSFLSGTYTLSIPQLNKLIKITNEQSMPGKENITNKKTTDHLCGKCSELLF